MIDSEEESIASSPAVTDEKTDNPSVSLQSNPSQEIFSANDEDDAEKTKVSEPKLPGTVSSSTQSSLGEVGDGNERKEIGDCAGENGARENQDLNKDLLHHLHADAELSTL